MLVAGLDGRFNALAGVRDWTELHADFSNQAFDIYMALACLNYLLIKVEQVRDAHSETDLCPVMVELAKFVFPVSEDSATEDMDLLCVFESV